MDLMHADAACLLVQSVDVLGDNGLKFARFFHFCKRVVRDVWLYVVRVKLLPVVFKEYFLVVVQAVMAQKIFGLVRVKFNIMLVVKAVLAPEIRYAAVG